MRHTRVVLWDHPQTLIHLVGWDTLFNAKSASMCGRSPWPGEWMQPDEEPGPVPQICVTCIHVARKQKR